VVSMEVGIVNWWFNT